MNKEDHKIAYENVIVANKMLEKEIERLQKENQILMNSMVTEAHTKETKEIERLNNIISELDRWLKEKKEQMEEFELYKRKETGAFWYSTIGNIETFIEKIEELKGSEKE